MIVPLVEDGDSPVAIRKTGEGEGAIGVALGEGEVLAVRVAKAHVALGPVEAVVRAAAVEPLIRRAAHALAGDLAGQGVVAVSRAAGDVRVGAVADSGLRGIDDRRVGKADASRGNAGPNSWK